jgi:hypothetical protein
MGSVLGVQLAARAKIDQAGGDSSWSAAADVSAGRSLADGTADDQHYLKALALQVIAASP